jgi:hypothetical protein
VLPFHENLGITVGAVLTDNGREFCGKPASHSYELLLAVEGIKHRTTKVGVESRRAFTEGQLGLRRRPRGVKLRRVEREPEMAQNPNAFLRAEARTPRA